MNRKTGQPRKTTRAAQGSGTIRQRKDGTWEARFTTGRDPGTGKQIQRSFYARTQKEVRQRLQQATVAVDSGTYAEPSRMTVGAWLDVWLSDYIGDVKPLTAAAYATQARVHIKPALGAVKLSDLKPTQVQAFYNALTKSGKAAKTVRNIHGILHRALSQAVSIGYIRTNPSDVCKLPRVVRKEIKPLDETDTRAFLDAIKGHPFEHVYVVDLFTGMRQGEILGLTWDCVDFESGSIRVSKQLQKERHYTGEGVKKKEAKYVFAPLKNDKVRLITPAPHVMRVLKERKRIQNAERLKAGAYWDEGDFKGLVFTNEYGKHLSHFYVYKCFKTLVATAGIPQARFHDLRHSYAVAALRSGDDVKTVQENLGHATATFTMDVYGHVTESMKQASASRMEAYIEALKNGDKKL